VELQQVRVRASGAAEAGITQRRAGGRAMTSVLQQEAGAAPRRPLVHSVDRYGR